ncbi:unnamed protein product, partial [Effrenium voratum]
AASLLVGAQLLVAVVGGASAASCRGPGAAEGLKPTQLAARVKRNLGDAGAAAPKLGATGGQFLHAQLSGQVKGRPGAQAQAQLGSEDVKVLFMKEQQHDCLILGSGSLLRGTTLADVQEAVNGCSPGDALAVATAVGQKAKSRQVHKKTDKACWVQSEQEENEITCCAVLVTREDLAKAPAQQVAKKQRLATEVKPTASLAEAAEKAQEKRWEIRDRSDNMAIGPTEQSGQAPELIQEAGLCWDPDVPAEAIPLTVPAEPDFSQFFQSGVHCAVIERMRRFGLMCDADIAGLRPDELVTAMSGFIDDEEAGWYIELARGALAFLARRASGAPQCARPVEGLPVPAVKRCRLVGSIAPGAFQWSQNALTALRPVHQHSEMVHACWEIYAALGTHGELWSPLLEEHQAIAREGLASRLQIFERRTLQAQLSALRRWANYVLQFGKGPAEVLLPPVALLFSFLKQASDGGPTAAQGLFQKLLWWRRHVGIPFPLGDPMVATWNRVAEGHSIQPRVPLSFRAFQALCKLALGGSTNVATFASLALIPLVACLRFAHAQRSADWTLSHDFARAVCLKGKSRKHGTRPSFEWAAPMYVGKWKHVLGLASRVIIDLRSQVPDLSFCIPDVACGPSGCLDERAHWRAAPMPMARFVKLLHSVLRSEGLPDAEVGLISTYSLRRFLPSVAEVLRTPVEVAQHLGNWTESVTTKHAQPMPVQMSQHYAHDRVLSAGHTKALLCAAVQELLETESGPLDW